jgi:GrpE
LHQDDALPPAGPPTLELEAALDAMAEEVARFRRVLLKQGHAQELFQGRLEQELQRLSSRIETMAPAASPRRGDALPAGDEAGLPNSAQQRALLELDQAVLHLLRLARGGSSAASSEQSDPRTVHEGLSLLQIRVRNLQRSFGLEAIPAVGLPFDDRLHRAGSVCHRSDLPDGQVAEELLPGYRLRGRLLRPALVTVNRRGKAGGAEG